MTTVHRICEKRIPILFRNVGDVYSHEPSDIIPARKNDSKNERKGLIIKRPRLLLLDDNLIFLKSLGRLLQKHAMDVDMEGCHHAALERFSVQPSAYDLALVDLNLKGSSGWDFAKKLNGIPNTPPVIIMSGDVHAVSPGAPPNIKGVLMKPFSVKHLKEEIDQWYKSAFSMS